METMSSHRLSCWATLLVQENVAAVNLHFTLSKGITMVTSKDNKKNKRQRCSVAQRSCSIEVDELLGVYKFNLPKMISNWKEWPQSSHHAKVKSRQMREARVDQQTIGMGSVSIYGFLFKMGGGYKHLYKIQCIHVYVHLSVWYE